jgi:iron complex outermembrane receptor protein
MQNHLLTCSSAVLAIAASLAAAAPAHAQSVQPPESVQEQGATAAAQGDGEIVVTGSRIRRNPLDLDSPVVFVDEEDIAKTGLNSINDVLQRLPSSGGGLNSKFNNSGNLGNPPDGGGVGAGAAEIDLRYLGSRRVLVLVDGLRFVNGASASGVPGSTDLNAIPESAIERVEVLQDGASAIYGSDAIAGVVNIITKGNQRGFEVSGQIGLNENGDGATQNYQASWGNGNDGPLKARRWRKLREAGPDPVRPARAVGFPEPYTDACQATCSSFTPNGRYTGSIFVGGNATLRAPGDRPPGDARRLPGFSSPADRFNFQPFNFLQIPLERVGVFGNLKYELTDSINFSVRTLYNQRKSKNQAAPLPFGFGPTSGLTPVLSNIVVSATNPFNPFRGRSGRQQRQCRGGVPALPGGRPAPVQPDGRHLLRRCHAGRRVPDRRAQLVLGRERLLRPQRSRADDVRQHQLGAAAPGARARSRAAPIRACRSTCSAGSDRSRPR